MNSECQMDESMTGRMSPDPLKFAFDQKRGAHAGGMGRPPLDPEQVQLKLNELLATGATPEKRRALYLHIPFCRVRCTFCSFFQYASSRKLVDNYFELLLQEIERKGATAYAQSAPFNAVYIGGGTPTDLSAEQLRILGQTIRRCFPLATDCEFTLEGRLNRFDDAKFEAAIEGGINRFSFGVQSFNTTVRKAAKRLDDRDYVMSRLKELNQADLAPIVIDLLFGLPYQTKEIWQQDLDDMLESGVAGADLYQLIDLKGTPMLRQTEQGVAPAPATTEFKSGLYRMGDAFMAKHRYRQLSCSHWARDERERSLYNSMVKHGCEILPVGAGAGGNFGGYASMQPRDLEQYQDFIDNNQWPSAMLMPKAESPIKAKLVGLCDQGGIARYVIGDDLFERAKPLFAEWQKRGLAEFDDHGVHFTLAGRFWQVNMCNGLLKFFEANPLEGGSKPNMERCA
ncbi:heme anaerobic degradation radical SAM methyltransferase ChuW/HutW [Ferrimonas aestuarii]|uniref:Heme anaerobic degradation radical SAM methyltransferase ChuW/HutW n=1 Tax=Ferrimonas aestuarii TaxID=2569539 RepID=A0A4U1BQ21_9GAMM|nr:heme anaerobic degradation radical SAM methyltransferase ChuW/HutW [Ferrimonas aestuarii]TKB53067.1 heme anaerobic degradation radical SAM methyltransferase ChuW/HutW [Ferrimonas aestuarii]